MANFFQTPLVNPFRFVNAAVYEDIDPRYNSLPFDYKLDGLYNPNSFYAQKWQTNDFTAFQFGSDFTGATFKIYSFTGGVYYDQDDPYRSIAITSPPDTIQGVTWLLYECVVNFAGWAEGLYVGVLSYVDQNGEIQQIQTSPLDVRAKHPGTLLYEYSNTENDKGIVWATGIRMSVRVEGLIREFTPKSLTEDYVDQQHNTYSLNDIPYRTFKNYIGSSRGLPDWIIDKMNIIFSLNQVSIEGTGYAKLSGQSFQITRPEKGYNEDGYASIEIIPNENINLEKYNSGSPTNGTFKVIAEVIQYYNNSANIAINGVFTTHTNLVGIALINKSAAAFVLKVGTTNGGNEIRQFNVSADATSFLLINKVFEQPENVFLTGLDGLDLDIDIRYDDYDASQSAPGVASASFIENVEYTYYEDVVGNFTRDWNVATGIGKPGTDFENCYLLDGQNNTIDDAYLFRMGLDKTVPALRQTIVGNEGNQLTITRNELPAEGIFCFTDDTNPTFGDIIDNLSRTARIGSTGGGRAGNYDMLKGYGAPAAGLSENLGSGNPTDITPECLVVARFIYRKP